MANDEISQVIELECKGFTYLIKGTIEAIRIAVKQIQAMHNWRVDKWEHHQQYGARGDHSHSYIMKYSESTPQVVQIPDTLTRSEEGMAAWDKFCKENKIPYNSHMPDFNTEDRRIPWEFRSQDVNLVQAFIQSYVDQLNKELEATKTYYDEQINKLSETIRTTSDPKEKADAERDLAIMKQAKEQNQKVIDINAEYEKKGNAMSFFDYMKQGENTEFAKDPALALAKLNEGIEISKEFTLLEAMSAIRDISAVPEGKKAFMTYTAKDDSTRNIFVERTFATESRPYVTSEYVVRIGDQEVCRINDADFTPAEYKDQIKAKLTEAGLTDAEINQFMFRTDRSEESYNLYLEYANSPELQAKVAKEAKNDAGMRSEQYDQLPENHTPEQAIEFEKKTCEANAAAKEDKQPVMNLSEDAKKFKENLTADRIDKKAEVEGSRFEISLDSSKLETLNTGAISYNMGEDIGKVTGITKTEDKDGNFKIAIQYDKEYAVEKDGFLTFKKGSEIAESLNSAKDKANSAVQTATQAATKGR